ncbi:MobA/MobL family protein, partial [Acinetobacter baumannii]
LNLKHNIKKEQSSLNAFHYLTRTAHFENQKDNEKLEFIRYGNMPKWAENKPKLFWKSADQFEISRGRTSSTLTIALPKELIREQRAELVQKLI